MEDMQRYGGTPAVLKYLLDNGRIHGDCMTCTGKTMAENLKNIKVLGDFALFLFVLDRTTEYPAPSDCCTDLSLAILLLIPTEQSSSI